MKMESFKNKTEGRVQLQPRRHSHCIETKTRIVRDIGLRFLLFCFFYFLFLSSLLSRMEEYPEQFMNIYVCAVIVCV